MPGPVIQHCGGCTANSIEIGKGATGTLISHVRVGGSEVHGPNTIQTCVNSTGNAPYTAEYVKALYCSGFKLNGGGTPLHDYCPNNYEIAEEHYECVTDDGTPGATTPLVIKDSTILNPYGQTAAIFLQGYGASIGEVRIENNLLAGGGYTIYGAQEEGRSPLVGPVVVTNNRFARCLSSCPDSHGYFEEGGAYHLKAHFNSALTTWSGNYWDNNLEAAR